MLLHYSLKVMCCFLIRYPHAQERHRFLEMADILKLC